MIDPVDKKPVTLDVEFAESRPFAFQRVIPVRVDQRIRVFGHQGLYRLTQFGGIVVLPSQTFPVSFEGSVRDMSLSIEVRHQIVHAAEPFADTVQRLVSRLPVFGSYDRLPVDAVVVRVDDE